MMLLTDKNYLPQKQTTMLVVIDPTVEAPHKLAEGVQTGASVLLLNPNFDSIAQITTALAAGNYGSLHLISHGSPGRLHLGKTNLNSDNIAQYKQQLLEWRIAEILIYGCNVAANPDLLIKLHVLTGANIAASAQEVGQGNWNLEWQKIGEITSGSAFAEELRQEYQGKFIGFLPQVTFAAGNRPNSLAIGDLDGDGSVDDLAVANNSSVNVSVLLGDGSGGFSAQTTFVVGDTPSSVAIGDLDGDGSADDRAVANLGSDTVSVLLGDGSGGFSAQTTFAVGIDPRSVAIGDLDGDGSADDLAVANQSSYNVSVLLGDGSGGFSEQTTFAVGDTPFSVAIGDLDGDGSADDLAVANRRDFNVSVLIECFLTGTRILTNQGEIAVEDLKIGNQVQTADGKLETIKWIGRQTIRPNQVRNPLRGYPVLIKAGALGSSIPCRDLYVSPDHSLFIDGILINAGALVNDISILKTQPTETFTYYHIELENHCLLIAEGAAAESYLPQKENREEYENFAEYEELYPQGSNLMLWPMDYPRISSWNKVPRFVSKKLMSIAHQIGNQGLKIKA